MTQEKQENKSKNFLDKREEIVYNIVVLKERKFIYYEMERFIV